MPDLKLEDLSARQKGALLIAVGKTAISYNVEPEEVLDDWVNYHGDLIHHLASEGMDTAIAEKALKALIDHVNEQVDGDSDA